MKTLSALATSVHASTTIAIDTKFQKMRADGIDVIGFGMGQPDFDTPEHIKEAGIQAIRDNVTKYTPTAGTMDVRRAVCHRLAEDYGLTYEPANVVVTAGAKHVLYGVLRTLVDPGDEVILPAPYWVSYYELIKMVGGVPVVVETTAETGFKMSAAQLEAAISPKTKALILNNPSNPTGMVYDGAALAELAKVCLAHDLYVVADEIYDKLLFDGRTFTSFASLGEDVKRHTVLVGGVSKTYCMTGWRIGFAACEPEIAKVMSNYLSHATSGTCSISQAATVAAYTGPQDDVERMRQQFEKRRDYLYERMSKIPAVRAVRSEATFYMMVDIGGLVGKTLYGKTIRDADDFAEVFLEKGLVAVVPCTGFGAPNYVRWSFAVSMENIKEGVDRLERFLAEA